MLAVVLGLATFYSWSKLNKLETSAKEYQEARYFPELEEEQVERIRVVSAEPKFQYDLVQKGDRWFIDSHLLSVEKTHQLVSSILELSREREMDPSPSPEREAEFQIDKPSFQLSVWGKGEKELGTIKLGKRTPDFNHFYGQSSAGGAISTVPAYTLGTLEEEPKELLENSLFPVEVAAVTHFSVQKGGKELLSLERDAKDEEKYTFQYPDLGQADESQVKKFLFQLKDLKIGRFLGEEEQAPLGETQVLYQAKLSYSDFSQVTELKQRVAANPKLVYATRYLLDTESKAPVEGSLERFVAEIATEGEVINPTASLFEDRRVLVFDLDMLKGLSIEQGGIVLKAEKNSQGKWVGQGGDFPEEALNGLLWVLKDLRFEAKMGESKEAEEEVISIALKRKSEADVLLRFSRPKNGQPYLWRKSEAFSLTQSSWETLSAAVSKLVSVDESQELEK